MTPKVVSFTESHRWLLPKAAKGTQLTALGPTSLDEMMRDPIQSSIDWDLRTICTPIYSALDYISCKLALQDVHVALILTGYRPGLIPVFPIGSQAQSIFIKIIQKAARKFALSPKWLDALTAVCEKTKPLLEFARHRTNSYLIHRSLGQDDNLFAGEGLTLLSVDCIYTLKTLLQALSKQDWIPSARQQCKESCIRLLRRVHSVYTSTKLSKSFLRRIYDHIELNDTILQEVCVEYKERYGQSGVAEMQQRRSPSLTSRSDSLPPRPAASRRATEPTIPQRNGSKKRLPNICTTNIHALGLEAVHLKAPEPDVMFFEAVSPLRTDNDRSDAQSIRLCIPPAKNPGHLHSIDTRCLSQVTYIEESPSVPHFPPPPPPPPAITEQAERRPRTPITAIAYERPLPDTPASLTHSPRSSVRRTISSSGGAKSYRSNSDASLPLTPLSSEVVGGCGGVRWYGLPSSPTDTPTKRHYREQLKVGPPLPLPLTMGAGLGGQRGVTPPPEEEDLRPRFLWPVITRPMRLGVGVGVGVVRGDVFD